MTAEAVIDHPLGPNTVDDWLAAEPPADGSHLELILGYLHVAPPPSGSHQHAAFELAVLLRNAIRVAKRHDLHVLPAVGVRISSYFRTALIPDVVVVDVDVHHVSFAPENVLLAVEVWSPGNTRAERETKMAAYAAAGVPHVWIVEAPRGEPVKFWGYRLGETEYRQEIYAGNGETITAPGPVPVEVDTSALT
ncbi:hypothetical protein GCM10017566_55110 [Amycolatopsis bartoniae]|uniref:Putative restriction endonuclease domain-containing protein n=1 Tax=Amycolatopsis bartoniae TaxID=941986 RepID=A0A8H9MEM6_9PSEU|nr:hypothetical protein GCM10017566_55110 [Amycolatopsis bartoniae]